MDRKALETKILELVSTSYNTDVSKLTLETTFKEDLKGASILLVGLASQIENELDVMIPLPEVSQAKTIGDLVDKVEEML
ncbi:MAG: acyl carrier protein [Anaerovoracaceae bacterium]|jgi:acyl carrier protein